MSRDFSGPLTEEDIKFLRQSLPEERVQHMISVQGLAEDKPKKSKKAENGSSKDEGKSEGTKPQGDPEGAGDPALEDLEDLIGGDPEFDSLGSTEAEIREHLEQHPEDKERVQAVEAARTDREPRKFVASL